MSIPGPSESEQIARLKRELEWAHMKIRALEERLRLQRIEKYGPKSEKLSDAPLELLEAEPGVRTAEVEAESQREPLAAASLSVSESKPGKVVCHPGRQQLPAHLPRVEQVVGCTADECVCQQCGNEKAVIGYEQSEHLDVEPARY